MGIRMIDFTKLDYLKVGNDKQKKAYEVLTKYKIFEVLDYYSPILTGTIPLGINIEGSDLDIICELDFRFEEDFLDDISFSQMIPANEEVRVEYVVINDEKSIIISFVLENFPIEIFAQNKPTIQQNAYLHMIAEYKILQEKGEEFKQKILGLKKKE